MKRSLSLLLVLGLMPGIASACACCSSPGDYLDSTEVVGEFEQKELSLVRFSDTASVYTGEADVEDAVQGLSHFASEYSVSHEPTKNGWSRVINGWLLRFRADGVEGALNLTLPKTMQKFAVDPQTSKEVGGLGPLLYKEWRLEGPVQGNGIFAKGNSANMKYFLVLQGQGLRCDSADQFHHWRLEIRGEKASYVFHGKLTQQLE